MDFEEIRNTKLDYLRRKKEFLGEKIVNYNENIKRIRNNISELYSERFELEKEIKKIMNEAKFEDFSDEKNKNSKVKIIENYYGRKNREA